MSRTRKELMSELDALGVSYKSDATKAELVALLESRSEESFAVPGAEALGTPEAVEPEAPVEVATPEMVEAAPAVEVPMADVTPEPIDTEMSVEEVKPVERLGYLGPVRRRIVRLGKKVAANGVEYNEVLLEDGTAFLLSDRDLEAQRSW